MRDLRTLLPTAAKEELRKEVSRRFQVLIDKHGLTNYYGEIKTMFKINIGLDLKHDYPYLNDMSNYESWFSVVFKEISEEAIESRKSDLDKIS